MNKNKDKKEFIDDGHTIYNMDVEGMPHRRTIKTNNDVYLTSEEKRTYTKAAYLAYLPIVIISVIAFTVAFVLIYLWLS